MTSITITSMVGFYLMSVLWAVDSGMAFIGFLKFFPVLLFLAIMMQDNKNSEIMLHVLPYVAVVLTVVSTVAMYIPALELRFSVAGRLAGFFQYPNTFAIFLLVSELLLVSRTKMKLIDYISLIVLVSGILLTGSRTVFVLALLANAVLILFNNDKKIRYFGIISVLLVVLGIVLFALVFESSGVVSRLMRLSFSESTFVGRVLYFMDAIPLILRTPFGLGYMGYYYIQQSIQTGVYSVAFIHNDWLQIMLDIGWIPCIFFVATFIKTLSNKKVPLSRKVILATMFLHSCFDFNFQFISIIFLLILLLDYESGKELVIKKQLFTVKSLIVVLGCISIYCGISLLLVYLDKQEVALKIYPWNTQAQTTILTKIKDTDEAGEIADRILARNEYVTLAYTVKSRQAYAKGDFGNVITYKNMLLEKAPFQYDECEEYAYMLINGISLYTKAGDSQSANVCKEELLTLPGKLQQAKARLSVLGKKIKDQPTTQFPQDIENYIEKLEKTK